MGTGGTITALSQAVGDRVNLEIDGGSAGSAGKHGVRTRAARVHVPSFSSLLVRRALLQVKNNVDASLYWHLRRRLMSFQSGVEGGGEKGERAGGAVPRCDAPGNEWVLFAAVVQSLVEDAGLPVTVHAAADMEAFGVREKASPAVPSGDEAWQQMLSSSFHQQSLLSGRLPDLVSSQKELFPCSADLRYASLSVGLFCVYIRSHLHVSVLAKCRDINQSGEPWPGWG